MGERQLRESLHKRTIIGTMVALGGLGTAIYAGIDGQPVLYGCGSITAVLSCTFVLVDYSNQDYPTHQTTEAEKSDHTFTPNPEFPVRE